MRKIRLLGILVLLLLCATAKAGRKGFYYRHFHIDAVVHPNNVWDITETLDVHFNEPRHGIYRYIPTRYWLMHDVSEDQGREGAATKGASVPDWRQFHYQNEVENVSVEQREYTTEDSDDATCVIRVGSSNTNVMGDQRYVIHYEYVYRDDRRPAHDFLFHTFLSTEFKESIEHFSFRIEFEKPLPDDIQQRLEIYGGEYGNESDVPEHLSVEATPRVITGTADHIAPHHGVTLYAVLPESYYEDVLGVNDTYHYLFLGTTFLLMALLLFFLVKAKLRHKAKGEKNSKGTDPHITLYVMLWLFSTLTFSTNTVKQTFDFDTFSIALLFWGVPFAAGAGWCYLGSIAASLSSWWKRMLSFFVRLLGMVALCWLFCNKIPDYGAPMSSCTIIILFAGCFVLCEMIGLFDAIVENGSSSREKRT